MIIRSSTRNILGFLNVSLFSLSVLAALFWGWSQRNEYWITAEKGLGYSLGLIGASMMLMLLLYPLRKNVRFFKGWLPIRYWFKAHMMLGILGPLLIIFHCNFNLGSTNSNVALFSMLLVVLSGLVGRFIYRRIHQGLYGQKLDLAELNKQYKQLSTHHEFPESIATKMSNLEGLLTAKESSLTQSFRSVRQATKLSKQLLKELKRTHKLNPQLQHYVELKVILKEQTKLLKKMIGLAFYTRLFSLWHVAHLPFFIMMVITAIIHIVIVHMY